MKIEINEKTPLKKFNHHWKFCVGSAHAAYALRHDYTRQLAQLHAELGIERVRFHGIFCDDMHTLHKPSDILPIPFSSRCREESFRQCAVAYDNVLEAGMQPFVELGFMPRLLAQHRRAKGMFFYKPIVSMPKSLAEWQGYIKSFVTFLIERYGREEVKKWYLEVWNEPDLVIPFFAGTKKDYFLLYEATSRAVKSVDEAIAVGGPATSAGKWIEDFVSFCKESNAPVDFVSTHQYAGDPIGGISDKGNKNTLSINLFAGLKQKRSEQDDGILDLYRSFMGTENAHKTLNRDALSQSSEQISGLVGALPLFYTEWNMCASFSAPCNDTSMQAAYILHNILTSQENISGSSVWCFSDLFEEFHQFPQEFHGGFGLMTQSGIKKPSYYALKFLNEAGDIAYDITSDGEADCVVFKKENELHIIISLLEFNDLDICENVQLCIALPNKPRSVILNRIDEEHCNPLAVWKSTGSPCVPTPRQVQDITSASAPTDENAPYEYADGALKIKTSVKANEVKRFIVYLSV